MKVSNFSLTLQIIVINLFVIFISFVLFGFFNFYSISRNLSIEDKTEQLTDLSNILVKSIVNNAIKVPLYSTQEEVLVQKNKEELEPYAIGIIIEVYKDLDKEIKVYDTSLNLIINSQDFYKKQIKVVSINYPKLPQDLTRNFYKKLNNFFSEKFVNFWYWYNKNSYSDVLVPEGNELFRIFQSMKKKQSLEFYFTDEKNYIFIKKISPLLKNNSVYGVVVVTDHLSDTKNIIADLSSNLLNNLLVTMIIVIMLSIFFARSIVNPIRKLSYITNQYRQNLSLSSVKNSFPKRGDEIGQLSKNLEIMSDELSVRINELERFAADVSHELKNPLTSIRSANDILQKNNKDINIQKKLISIIDKDTAKMNRLITDISNYTRTKAEIEMYRLENRKINIVKLLKDVIENYSINKKNINFEFRCPHQNLIIFSNYEKIVQVMIILLDNAISFAPNNSSILVVCESSEGESLISIADQGTGIKLEYSKKIFDRFYKDRSKDDGKHSGLGLDIARHIVESYGGSIYLENKKIKNYQGACFVIKFPLKDAN